MVKAQLCTLALLLTSAIVSMMTYSFCPKCGRALKDEQRDGQTIPICQSPACGFVFWQNSKPTVCVLIGGPNGTLLITTRGIDPDKGKLDFPGGFLHEGEHPNDCARREVQEELGVEITITDHAGFFIDRYGADGDYTLNIGLVAEITNGTPQPADDVVAIAWVNPKDIDHSQLAFANNAFFLDWWIKHRS